MSKRKQSRKQRVIELRVNFGRDMVIGGMSAPNEEPFRFYGIDAATGAWERDSFYMMPEPIIW